VADPQPIPSNLQHEDGTPLKFRLIPLASTPAASTKAYLTLGGSGQAVDPIVGKGSHAFGEAAAPGEREKLDTREFPHFPEAPAFTLFERWQKFDLKITTEDPKTLMGTAIVPTGAIYLFNVIVALEWLPSKRTVDTLMRAFRAASDVLYDATNGGMAFGQVVFAGPEHLKQADIQILASNRFHPRSMVEGLTDPKKFSPIRLGRGIWRKDRHILLAWDENTGYRAIAHEWAHYALGLHDEYLDATLRVSPTADQLSLVEDPVWGDKSLVVPRVLVALQTLMETLDSDELVPLLRQIQRTEQLSTVETVRKRILNTIEQHYPGMKQRLERDNPGPSRFPFALPRFFRMPDTPIGTSATGEERYCTIDQLDLDHCWLYSYWMDNSTLRIIAQGSVDDQAKPVVVPGLERLKQAAGFQLLGAQTDGRLLAIGLEPTIQPGQLRPTRVQRTPLAESVESEAALEPPWEKVEFPASMPVIAVMPAPVYDPSVMKVKLRIIDPGATEHVWLATPGEAAANLLFTGLANYIETNSYQQIEHMDGIVALSKASDIFWVAEFSYGGNPPTTVRSPGAPISAGSSDGNLMIFSALDDALVDDPNKREPFYNKPIVTTRNYAGFEEQGKRVGTPAGYLFSVAAAAAVSTDQKPTIVMYYDAGALVEGKRLVIHRYDHSNAQWRPLPTYLPLGSFYAATPINAATAPSLVDAHDPLNGRVEYYRLFSIPPL